MDKKNTMRASIIGGLSGAIFFGGLLLAVLSGHFLVVFFLTLALTSLVGSLSAFDLRAASGGFQGCIFFVGLALLAAYDWWWPGILVLLGISALLGGLHEPLMMLISRRESAASTHEESPAMPDQVTYRPYQQGYERQEQPPVQDHERQSGEEGELSLYEQPQANYPQMSPPLQ